MMARSRRPLKQLSAISDQLSACFRPSVTHSTDCVTQPPRATKASSYSTSSPMTMVRATIGSGPRPWRCPRNVS